MNLTDLLVPTYRNMLRTLRGLIDKARRSSGGSGAEALLLARLAPDMFPLATQIRFACLQAQEAPLRLLGRTLGAARRAAGRGPQRRRAAGHDRRRPRPHR
jgi:hypothetical protein